METTEWCSLCGNVLDPEDGTCSAGCDDVFAPPSPSLIGPTAFGTVLLVSYLVAHSFAEGPTVHLIGLALVLIYPWMVGAYLGLMRGFDGPGLGALVLVLFAIPCGWFLLHAWSEYELHHQITFAFFFCVVILFGFEGSRRTSQL